MDEFTLAQQSLQLVRKDLGFKEDISLEDHPDPFEPLLVFLEKRIKHMLDVDFASLLNAMYRIDIPEDQVKVLLELTKPQDLAKAIATAIIEREKQKAITRQKYRPS
jgi:hypothetical protein